MNIPLRSKVRRFAAAWVGLAAVGAQAHDYYSWNPLTDGDVANLANWGAPALNSNSFLLFDASAPPLFPPTLNSAVLVGGLEFSSSTVSYTLSGTGLLTIGDYDITNSSALAQTIAVALTFTGSGSYHRINNEGTLTLSGAIANSSGAALKLAGSGADGRVTGAISGTDDVIKYQSGTWTLTGANTFTGRLLVEEGTLKLTGTNATTDIDLFGGATLDLDAANTLAAGADVSVDGLGTLNVNFSQTIAGLASGSNGAQALVNLASGATLTFAVPNDTTSDFAGVIADAATGAAGAIGKTGAGQQILSGLNTYTGGTTITGGVLTVSQLALGGTASGLGASTSAAANLVLNGGTLRYSGPGDTTDRLFTLGSAGGTLDAAGLGAVTFSNTGAIAFLTNSTSALLTLDAPTNYAANYFNPLLADAPAGVTSLRKNGLGQWVLGAANTFTGTTQIDYGTLTLAHSLALQRSTAILSANGALTFRGLTSATLGGLAANDTTATLALQDDAATPAALALTVGGNNTSTTFAGTLTGAGALTKTGTGTLTLSGTNTYAGGTALAGGTLTVPNDAALGDASGTLTFDGGTLKLDSLTGGPFVSARPVTLGTGGGTINTNSYEATFSGVIGGGGALTFQGTGILTLAGANTYGGGTTVQGGGVLDFTADHNLGATAGAVTLNGGALRTRAAISDFTHAITLGSSGGTFNTYGFDTTISGTIGGNGLLLVQSQTGNGRLTLTAANTYTGSTQLGVSGLYSGYLTLAHAGGGTLPAGGDVLLQESSVLQLATAQTIRKLVSTSTTSSVVIDPGQTLTINLPSAAADAPNSQATFAGVISGGGVLAIDGPGQFTVTGVNTYSGGTQIDGGTLVVSQDANLGNTAVGLSFNGGTLQTAAALTSARGLLLGANGGTIDTHGFTSTFSGQLSGAGGLTVKSLAAGGVLTLTNSANQFAGSTSVVSGTLRIGATGALGALGASKVDIATGATLDVAASQTLGGLSGSGLVNLAAGQGLTLDLGQSGTFSGSFQGAGSLTKSGAATLTLSGTGSTHSGDTQVAAGWLADGAAGAYSTGSLLRVNAGANLAVDYAETVAGLDDYATLTSGTVTLGSAGSLTVANGAANTFSGTFGGQGGFTKSGAGTLTFRGSSSFTGTAAIAAGTLTVGAAEAFTAGTLTVATGATFDVAHSTTLGWLQGTGTTTVASGQTLLLKNTSTLSAVIGGAGGVTFDNAGQSSGNSWISTAQTYTGLTTVATGTLNLGLGGSSGVTGSVAGDIFLSATTSTLNFSRGPASYTYAGVISGSGQVRKGGGGTLTLTGANTYTGATTVNNGTLRLGAANTLPTTTSLDLASGAKLDVAADQTIGRFANSSDSLIEIALGKIFTVALGNLTAGTTYDGVISGDGALVIGSNNGNGHAVALAQDNTYTGGTTILAGGALQLGVGTSGGTIAGDVVDHGTLSFWRSDDIVFNGRISGTGRVVLGSAASLNGSGDVRFTAANTYTGGVEVYSGGLFAMNSTGSATGTGAVVLHGGFLAGTGSVAGAVTLETGATIAPASDLGVPGTLTIGAGDFAGGTKFAFQINDATGQAGAGYSLLNVVGALNFSGSSANPFVVQLYSGDPQTRLQGLTANFDPAQAYRWMFLSTGGGITGFTTTLASVDASTFANSFSGTFGVSQSGNSLYLDYTPAAVPEPSTWALLAVGVAALGLLGHRRRPGR